MLILLHMSIVEIPMKDLKPSGGLFASHERLRGGECSTSGRTADTWIIPTVQLGSAGLRQVHLNITAYKSRGANASVISKLFTS